MADSGPSVILRSLVERAIDENGTIDSEGAVTDGHQAVVTERGSDPPPVDLLLAVVSGTGSNASADGELRAGVRSNESVRPATDEASGPASIVGVIPRIEAAAVRQLRDAIDDPEGDRTIRLVFTGDAAERLAGGSGAVLRSALARHKVEAAVHNGNSPLAVLLVGERAVVGLFDDDGLAALLCSDAPEVRSWAAGVYRRYAAAASDTAAPSVDVERS